MGLPGARSLENWTEMVEPLSTLSPVGAVATTSNGGGGVAVVAEAGEVWERGIMMNPAAATATTKAATAITHRRVPVRSFLRECFPGAIAAAMLSVVVVAQAGREAQIAAVI